MRRLLPTCLILMVCCAPAALAQSYRLVWSDEFSGTTLDLNKWEHQTGTGCPQLCGWGNNELQYYRSNNTTVAGGLLTITAKAESFGGQSFTSSRLRTRFRGDWTYGRIEMRAKMPAGQGLWPALWMLPTDEVYGTWAASGEIYLLEYLGHQTNRAFGTIHYGAQFPGNQFSSTATTLNGVNLSTSFHDYAFEWEPCEMRWYIDGALYATKRDWSSSGGPYPAPFDQRFHLLLNLAVGGNLPGSPNGTTVFPQTLTVDYVRVYQYQDVSACVRVFDAMDHGNPGANGWFSFNGSVGGGGIGGSLTDLPPVEGCKASLAAGYGSGGAVGFQGGFGRTNPMDLTGKTHFTFWIRPDATQTYRLELNLQDDDNGDNTVPAVPNGLDDEFQYNLLVAPSGPGAIAGGGWQKISIPISAFTDDNSFHYGGNGVFDPKPTSAGGNGQLVNVVVAVVSTSGSDATFRTDRWAFTRQVSSFAGKIYADTDLDGVRDPGEAGIEGVTVQLWDAALATMLASLVTPASGDYTFANLPAGPFEVRVLAATLPPGALTTNDPDGAATANKFAEELACDQVATARDFGFALAALDVDDAGRPRVPLAQNAPNPFRPRTMIAFDLARDDLATLSIVDVAGRPVRTLLSGQVAAGPHRVEWDGRDEQGRALSEGVYFYTLATADGRWVKRMTLLR